MSERVVNMAGIGGQLAPEWWSTSAGIYIIVQFDRINAYLEPKNQHDKTFLD
jgi:hypothetical protein